jgi:hypothetical protein
MLNWFSKAAGNLKFRYAQNDINRIDIDFVITVVSLSFNWATKLYALDPTNAVLLNEYVENCK